jgi:hypothetical protein
MNRGLERVNDPHFWNPGVVSYAMVPRWHFNSRVFFFIVPSIVYGLSLPRRFLGPGDLHIRSVSSRKSPNSEKKDG